MKKSIIFIASILLALCTQAQLRFKKIYPLAMASSKEEAFDLFMDFQRQNPDHMNTYYQLGRLSLHWMFGYDPLISYKDVSKHCYNARLYFGLARHHMTEREVRRNQQYFQGIRPLVGEELQFSDVKNYLDSIYAMVQLYEKKTAEINLYFNKSIDFYNTCVDQYKMINDRNARLKDMVLTIDDSTIEQAKSLKQNYDSALIYFQQYSNEVSTYDLVKYDQKLVVHPISTYRLEGLSQQNFLKPKIDIYDYGKWVDQLFETLDTNIALLRKAIKDADTEFDKTAEFLNDSNTIVNKETELYRFTNKLKYQIGKFDNSSLVIDWFSYRDAQIELLTKNKDPLLNPKDSSAYPILRRAKLFEELINAKLKCDKNLKIFEKHISAAKVNKYPNFFKGKYKGIAGLNDAKKAHKEGNGNLLRNSLAQLDSFRVADIKRVSQPDGSFLFKRLKVPHLDTISLSLHPNNSFKTTVVKMVPKGGFYIAGLHKINKRIIKPYVAFSQDGKSIDWLRKLNIKGIKYADTIIVNLLPTGCTALIHGSLSPQRPAINVLVRFDEFGNEQGKTIMQTGSIPHSFIFDDINETILSVYKGSGQTSLETDSALVYFNKTDGSPIWSVHLPVEGSIAGLSKMDKNYIVFSNFKKYFDGKHTHESGCLGKNTCATLISGEGKIIGWEKYLSSTPVRISDVLKLNDNSINLLGTKESTVSNPDQFVYILLDAEGKLKFKN